MLTPEDMQKKIFALGRKLENNDVGMFVKELQINYQFLYNEVNEQKKQIKGMEAKLQHYRNIESSLQEAMVSAEKVSEDKLSQAEHKAREIEKNAYKKADDIIFDAKKDLDNIKKDIDVFKKDYLNYQNKYKEFVLGQLKFIEDAKDFMSNEGVMYKDVDISESTDFDEPEESHSSSYATLERDAHIDRYEDSHVVVSKDTDVPVSSDFFKYADLEKENKVSAKSEDDMDEYDNPYKNILTSEKEDDVKDNSIIEDTLEDDAKESVLEAAEDDLDAALKAYHENDKLNDLVSISQENILADVKARDVEEDIEDNKEDIEDNKITEDSFVDDIKDNVDTILEKEPVEEVNIVNNLLPKELVENTVEKAQSIEPVIESAVEPAVEPINELVVKPAAEPIIEEDKVDYTEPIKEELSEKVAMETLVEDNLEVTTNDMSTNDISDIEEIVVPVDNLLSEENDEDSTQDTADQALEAVSVEEINDESDSVEEIDTTDFEEDFPVPSEVKENERAVDPSLKDTVKSIMNPIVQNIQPQSDTSLEDIISMRQSQENKVEAFEVPTMSTSEEIPDFEPSNNVLEITDLNNNGIDDSIEVDFQGEFGKELIEQEFELPELDFDSMDFGQMEMLDDLPDLTDSDNLVKEDTKPESEPLVEQVQDEVIEDKVEEISESIPEVSVSDNVDVADPIVDEAINTSDEESTPAQPDGAPSLNINNNIELININKSLFTKTKSKEDKNAEILKSMNLSSKKKEEPLLDLPPKPSMESFFSQELLASNLQMMKDSIEKEKREKEKREKESEENANTESNVSADEAVQESNVDSIPELEPEATMGFESEAMPNFEPEIAPEFKQPSLQVSGPSIPLELESQGIQGNVAQAGYGGQGLQGSGMQGGYGGQGLQGSGMQGGFGGQGLQGNGMQGGYGGQGLQGSGMQGGYGGQGLQGNGMQGGYGGQGLQGNGMQGGYGGQGLQGNGMQGGYGGQTLQGGYDRAY